MEIRTFDPDQDYGEVLSLWEACAPGIQISPSDSLQEVRHKLGRDPELFLVAVESERIIGTVIGGYDGRRGLVYHLAVLPDHRRKGLAGSLMNELEDRMRSLGCYKYYLLVTRDNHEALGFYRSIGCDVMDLHVMGKVLI